MMRQRSKHLTILCTAGGLGGGSQGKNPRLRSRKELGRCPHFSRRNAREMGRPQDGNLLERLYGGSLVVFHVKHRIELGDLKQIVDLLGKVQQFEFAALVLGRGERADQFANA